MLGIRTDTKQQEEYRQTAIQSIGTRTRKYDSHLSHSSYRQTSIKYNMSKNKKIQQSSITIVKRQ